MTKVPLIPFQRLVPQVLLKHPKTPVPTKGRNTKKDTTVAKTETKTAAKFTVFNSEDITKKPKSLQALWGMLSAMDPDGELFVQDKGIVQVAGGDASTKGRTPKALKFTPEMIADVEQYGVADGPEPDNAELATGVLFTMYQMLELAYARGAQDEALKVSKAMTKAAVAPVVAAVDDDEADDEDADDDDLDDSAEAAAVDDEDDDEDEDEDEDEEFDDEDDEDEDDEDDEDEA